MDFASLASQQPECLYAAFCVRSVEQACRQVVERIINEPERIESHRPRATSIPSRSKHLRYLIAQGLTRKVGPTCFDGEDLQIREQIFFAQMGEECVPSFIEVRHGYFADGGDSRENGDRI
jgi:hypothetical protein